VENRVVAHLTVGDTLVDLPVPVYLTVEITLGLDTLFVVLVDQPDLGSTADAAGNHVLADNIGDIQKIDGRQMNILFSFSYACGCDYPVDLIQHCHHGFVSAGRPSEYMESFAPRAD